MRTSKSLSVLTFSLCLFSCGDGFKVASKASSSVAAASTQTTPQNASVTNNPLTFLEINYFAAGSTLSFHHHSGDSVLVNSMMAFDPESNVGSESFVGFVVNKEDAFNGQNISLINTDSGAIIASTACTGQPGLECFNRVPVSKIWFSNPTCSTGRTSYFVPTLGNYKVQFIYADGSERSSAVIFQDPCASATVVKNADASRSLASVDNEKAKSEIRIYLSIVILFSFSLVLMGLYLKSTRK